MKHIKLFEQFLNEAEIPGANYLTPSKKEIDSWKKADAMAWLDRMYDESYNHQQRNRVADLRSTGEAIEAVTKYLQKKGLLKESESQEVNEEVKIDTDLAQITVDVLADENKKFDELLYLNLDQVNAIKSRYGKLPRGFAGPTKYIMAGLILSRLAGDDVYVDGRTDLVKGDKTVLNLKKDTTWADVKKALKI
jgi:hypothetical protein